MRQGIFYTLVVVGVLCVFAAIFYTPVPVYMHTLPPLINETTTSITLVEQARIQLGNGIYQSVQVIEVQGQKFVVVNGAGICPFPAE